MQKKLRMKNSGSESETGSGRTLSMVIVVQLLVLAGLLGVLGYRKLVAGQGEGTTPSGKPNRSVDVVQQGKHTKEEIAIRTVIKPEEKIVSVDYYRRPLGRLARPSILIEKSKLRLTVYDDERIVKRYLAAVGAGEGDKIRQGDYRTPEGEFIVCVKNPASKYVLSLGLSYPNLEDAERGLRDGLVDRKQYRLIVEAIRAGRQPPWNTALGGEIMIHGRRDSGRETLGCIALEDADIRELYPQIRHGTVVTIRP